MVTSWVLAVLHEEPGILYLSHFEVVNSTELHWGEKVA